MSDIVIIGAARTAVGTFMGGLSPLSAAQMGSIAIQEALQRAGIEPDEADEVIMGQVLSAANGQNPARQAAIGAGIPYEKTAYIVNQVCGSGLRSVALGLQAIQNGDAHIVVSGGQENMSQAPHCALLRNGQKAGNMNFIDTMIHDGLWCAHNDYHMGKTAENIAQKFNITREDQDHFAALSQEKAAKAQKNGIFRDEIVAAPVVTRKQTLHIEQDEHLRPDTNVDMLAKLRPAFDKNGSITAGNASGINDGAAACVVTSAALAERRNIKPLARIASWASAGVDPAVMGSGPVPASRKALERAGWSVGELELVESNEAFAAQALYVNREMSWDPDIVNVNGGAIALGHPIGASGCRILVTLLYEMVRRDARKALATLCIGGGMGIAMCLERD